MQNTSPKMVGRRALIKGTAMLAVTATARAQGQPPAEPVTTLADVPQANLRKRFHEVFRKGG